MGDKGGPTQPDGPSCHFHSRAKQTSDPTTVKRVQDVDQSFAPRSRQLAPPSITSSAGVSPEVVDTTRGISRAPVEINFDGQGASKSDVVPSLEDLLQQLDLEEQAEAAEQRGELPTSLPQACNMEDGPKLASTTQQRAGGCRLPAGRSAFSRRLLEQTSAQALEGGSPRN